MRKYLLLTGIVLLAGAVLSGCGGTTGGTVDVSVNAQNAFGIGSVQMELVYDAGLLQVTSVKAGKLASNALVESNAGNPGRVIIGIVDAAGINGEGPLVNISFKVVGKGESCTLTLEKITAYQATTLTDVLTKANAGSINVKRGAESPVISFSP